MSLITHPLENTYPFIFTRFAFFVFPVLFALAFVIMMIHLLQPDPTEAKNTFQQGMFPTLHWIEFTVVTSTVRTINVHDNYVLWSAYMPFADSNCEDYEPYPQEMKIYGSFHPPREDYWAICLYNYNSLKMLSSSGDLIYPDLYGNWVVMDRNYYLGTLRAENIMTGEKRDVWSKEYEERTPPHIYKEIIVSSPDNKSLIAYNLITEVFTNVTYIPDYPDSRSLSGDIDENLIVWNQATNANYDFDIMGFDLTTQIIFTITDSIENEFLIGIENNTVYWIRSGVIYKLNLITGEDFQLDPIGNLGAAEVSNEWIVWTDDRHGNPTLWDVYAYNMTSQQEYRITQQSQPIFGLGFDGTLIAWITGENGSSYGKAIRAVRLLPYSTFLPVLQR